MPSFIFSGYVTTRQHCPNKVLNLRCEALENADQNSELEWHWVHNNKQRVLVALCNRSLECGVVKASIEGMKVLGISNGTLLIERSPRKTTSGNVELVCTVHTKKPVRSQPVKLDLSLECKLGAVCPLFKTYALIGSPLKGYQLTLYDRWGMGTTFHFDRGIIIKEVTHNRE